MKNQIYFWHDLIVKKMMEFRESGHPVLVVRYEDLRKNHTKEVCGIQWCIYCRAWQGTGLADSCVCPAISLGMGSPTGLQTHFTSGCNTYVTMVEVYIDATGMHCTSLLSAPAPLGMCTYAHTTIVVSSSNCIAWSKTG